jgi:hypothetical protein
MTRKLIFVIVLCLSMTIPASAEFYKYYDPDGNLRFTDDINQVPPDQRQSVKTYSEVESESEEQASPGATPPAALQDETAADEVETSEGQPFDYEQRIKELDATKLELANEYKALMEENARLAELKKTVKTPEQVKQYNEGVKALNQKLKEHDRKRKAFFSAVEEYNAKVDSQNKRKNIK